MSTRHCHSNIVILPLHMNLSLRILSLCGTKVCETVKLSMNWMLCLPQRKVLMLKLWDLLGFCQC